MGCTKVGHYHYWPTSNVLKIQRCEVRCNFCIGPKAQKEFKYAWFLRRHVRTVHCKKGAKYEGLIVSEDWDDEGKKSARKARFSPRKGKAAMKIKEEENFDEYDSADDETDEEKGGLDLQQPLPSFVAPPDYPDVDYQFPAPPFHTHGNLHANGNFTIDPAHLSLDHSLSIGPLTAGENLLNPADLEAFLKCASRSPIGPGGKSIPGDLDDPFMDTGEDNGTSNLAGVSDYFGLTGNSAQYGANPENLGDQQPDTSTAVADHEFLPGDNKHFYMSDESSSSSDIFAAYENMPLAHSRQACNFNAPAQDGPTSMTIALQLMCMLESTFETFRGQGLTRHQMVNSIQMFSQRLLQPAA